MTQTRGARPRLESIEGCDDECEGQVKDIVIENRTKGKNRRAY